MTRRAEIQMSDDEVATFLDEQRTMTCATFARGVGRISRALVRPARRAHLGLDVAKSQKALDSSVSAGHAAGRDG